MKQANTQSAHEPNNQLTRQHQTQQPSHQITIQANQTQQPTAKQPANQTSHLRPRPTACRLKTNKAKKHSTNQPNNQSTNQTNKQPNNQTQE
jgi:hypothetical protein